MESKRKHQTQLVKSYDNIQTHTVGKGIKKDLAGIIASENLDPTAKIPSKISAGRVVIIPVSPDPSYISQSITDSMLAEERFKATLTSSHNQIGFICTLTKNFCEKRMVDQIAKRIC